MTEGKKAILLVTLFLLVLGGIYFYKTYSFHHHLEKLNETIQQEQEMITTMKAQIASNHQEKLLVKVKENYLFIPAEHGIPQLLSFIDQAALETNTMIEEINIENPVVYVEQSDEENKKIKEKQSEKNLVQTVPVTIAVRGKYLDIHSFIQKVYEEERLINLLQWEWKMENTDDEEPEIVAHLSYEVYYAPKMKEIVPSLAPIEAYQLEDRINPFH